MSPKLKRVFSIASTVMNSLLSLLFLFMLLDEGDPFYLFILLPLAASLFVSVDHLIEMNHKIKVENDLKAENQLLKDAAAARAFRQQTSGFNTGAAAQQTPFTTGAEKEEQDLAELLRARTNNTNQNYHG